jgi:glycosyltransferase involved in cell wall biosynthesis
VSTSSAALRLGFACAWWHPRESTWSYSASRLREALDATAEVEDIEAQRSLAGKAMLRAINWPRRGIPWQYSKMERALVDRAVRRSVAALRPDAVLGIGEVDTPTEAPTFQYQDTNAAALLAYQDQTGLSHSNLLPSRRELLESWGARQIERSRQASAVFTMSRWYGDFLVERGVAPKHVVAVGAGMNNPPTIHRDPVRAGGGRILFTGTDFLIKAGDVVVEAVRRLHKGGDRPVRLTVVGPTSWPLEGSPPEFVDFKGRLTPGEMSAEYANHDVLAMPSRFEGFGIVLAEALVAGLPCIARRAFAMPEIVEEGVTGALVDSEDPDELAAALDRVLADTDIFARVAAARETLRARYDWGAVARSMTREMAAIVGGESAGTQQDCDP